MTNKNNGTLKYRVEQLEKNVNRMDDKIDAILENHLPHINSALASLSVRVNLLVSLIVGAIIIETIIKLYK